MTFKRKEEATQTPQQHKSPFTFTGGACGQETQSSLPNNSITKGNKNTSMQGRKSCTASETATTHQALRDPHINNLIQHSRCPQDIHTAYHHFSTQPKTSRSQVTSLGLLHQHTLLHRTTGPTLPGQELNRGLPSHLRIVLME